MTEIKDEKELKGVLTDALSAFADFCDERQLRYYLLGGTLLGAIRHRGFIPWDDDIDVGLPRPDYERFIEASRGGIGGRYVVESYETHRNHVYPFAKMYDTRTYLVEDRHVPTENSGLFIDIFPVDGIPEDTAVFAAHVRRLKRWRTIAGYAGTSVLKGKNPIRTLVRLIVVAVCKTLGTRFFLSRIDGEARKYDFDECAHVAVTVWGYGVRERMVKETFLPREKAEFENRQFSVSSGYRLYLSSLYGDYMSLPPEDQRKSRHQFHAFWRQQGA